MIPGHNYAVTGSDFIRIFEVVLTLINRFLNHFQLTLFHIDGSLNTSLTSDISDYFFISNADTYNHELLTV